VGLAQEQSLQRAFVELALAWPLTVVVLEDEEPVRVMLVRVLNMLGHKATAAADG